MMQMITSAKLSQKYQWRSTILNTNAQIYSLAISSVTNVWCAVGIEKFCIATRITLQNSRFFDAEHDEHNSCVRLSHSVG